MGKPEYGKKEKVGKRKAMAVQQNRPFRIVVLGDFSGRQNRGLCETGDAIAQRRCLRIDRDNFEQVMEKLDVRLNRMMVVPEEGPLSLQFQELDDFHPDRLFDQLGLFAKFRSLRRRLSNRNTFEQAAEEVLSWGTFPESASPEPDSQSPDSQSTQPPPASAAADPAAPGTDNLLDQILQQPAQPSGDDAGQDEWNRFIDEIVAPYREPRSDDRQPELIRCVDEATQATMTAVLHHPSFRELESAWRALHLLVHRLETDERLKIFVVDVSKRELTDDLLASEDLRSTGIHRLLVQQSVETPGSDPWSVIVGNYEYGPADQDAHALGTMAKIAAAAGASYLTGANRQLVGGSGPIEIPDTKRWEFADSDAWQATRALHQSTHVGLAWPRFLLRLPYGKQTRPIEQFAFEEMSEPFASDRLLWGNSAFLCATLLGQSFSESGWSMSPGRLNQVDGLPVYFYREDGEAQAHPCGEFLLRQDAITHLQSIGVIPCISFRDRDSVCLDGWCSLKGTSLAGPW
jgi:type VI secretion system protein ImpC